MLAELLDIHLRIQELRAEVTRLEVEESIVEAETNPGLILKSRLGKAEFHKLLNAFHLVWSV
jgi:hypothetical protein